MSLEHDHLTDHAIRAFVFEELDRDAVESVEAHLEECEACAERVAAAYETLQQELRERREAATETQAPTVHELLAFAIQRGDAGAEQTLARALRAKVVSLELLRKLKGDIDRSPYGTAVGFGGGEGSAGDDALLWRIVESGNSRSIRFDASLPFRVGVRWGDGGGETRELELSFRPDTNRWGGAIEGLPLGGKLEIFLPQEPPTDTA